MADNARPVVPFGLGFSLGTLFGLGGACVVQLLLRGALLGAAVDAAPEEVAPVEAAVIAPAQEPAPVAQPPVEEAPAPVDEPPAEAPKPRPRQRPAPAPAPAAPVAAASAAPAPAAPAPVAPAPAPTAVLSGPTEVVFVGEDGTRHPANAVPPGKFEVLANWGDGLVPSGSITVKNNKPPKLLCDPATRTCSQK